MISRRASSFLAVCTLGFSLSGCVAAAIPAVAAAGMMRAGTDGKDAEGRVEVAKVEDAAAPAQVADVDDGDALVREMMAARKVGGPLLSTAAPAAPTTTASIPAPYARMIDYAVGQVTSKTADQPLQSALLRNPSALDAERQPCGTQTPIVFIDLDPRDGRLNADNAAATSTALSNGLAQLREEGIAIAWISQGTAGDAGAIRTALTRTGLDPEGEDALVLMRYPGDRKQTRREELARDHCVLAIAGDHRGDFDELYEYLRKPEAGEKLEQLIGNGWFLVPPALGPAPTLQLSSKEPDQ